tara:strand:- start:59 stop:322 length:264 start_codon:yes stop_codon:yes gene_type:complete
MITTATESDFHDFWHNEMIAHPTDIIDRDKLQANYINRVLDDMDIKDMMAILYDYMDVEFDKYTIDELIEQVDQDYPEIMEDSGFDN